MLKKIVLFMVGLVLGLGIAALSACKIDVSPANPIQATTPPTANVMPEPPKPTNYLPADPKQQPINPLRQTEERLNLPGVCYPTDNGEKDEPNTTDCGGEGTAGVDYDINLNGDRFKATLHREAKSNIWTAILDWVATPGVEIEVNFTGPKPAKITFHQEHLTGTGKKTVHYSQYPGKILRYFSWQAYRVKP